MNKSSKPETPATLQGLDELLSLYEKGAEESADELPPLHLDKQIIAAAHAQAAKPLKTRQINNTWWRRLSLPLYVAATFTFTAIAAHWFWPTVPKGVLPFEASDTVRFETKAPETLAKPYKAREAKPLPEQSALMAPPPIIDGTNKLLQKSKATTQKSVATIQAQQQVLLTSELKKQSTLRQKVNSQLAAQKEMQAASESRIQITGSRIAGSPAEHEVAEDEVTADEAADSVTDEAVNAEFDAAKKDKEVWARQIIKLYQKGEFLTAKQELRLFKQAFPDYPIDEQIKTLHRR